MMNDLISIDEFERLVEEALRDLPEEFRALLENISIIIESEPDDDDLAGVEGEDVDDDGELLGIFRGIPRTEKSFDALPAMPDQIAIFSGPVLRVSRSRREAVREIRETVIHELGHYFGLGDDDMPF